MDSREGSLEELISELDDGSGDGTGGRGVWAGAEAVLHRSPFQNIWAKSLAALEVALPNRGLSVTIGSGWTPCDRVLLPSYLRSAVCLSYCQR